jgi:hypothetical protein
MKENEPPEDIEDTTLFGEFIATFDRWTGTQGTHDRGRELEGKGKPTLENKENSPDQK